MLASMYNGNKDRMCTLTKSISAHLEWRCNRKNETQPASRRSHAASENTWEMTQNDLIHDCMAIRIYCSLICVYTQLLPIFHFHFHFLYVLTWDSVCAFFPFSLSLSHTSFFFFFLSILVFYYILTYIHLFVFVYIYKEMEISTIFVVAVHFVCF